LTLKYILLLKEAPGESKSPGRTEPDTSLVKV